MPWAPTSSQGNSGFPNEKNPSPSLKEVGHHWSPPVRGFDIYANVSIGNGCKATAVSALHKDGRAVKMKLPLKIKRVQVPVNIRVITGLRRACIWVYWCKMRLDWPGACLLRRKVISQVAGRWYFKALSQISFKEESNDQLYLLIPALTNFSSLSTHYAPGIHFRQFINSFGVRLLGLKYWPYSLLDVTMVKWLKTSMSQFSQCKWGIIGLSIMNDIYNRVMVRITLWMNTCKECLEKHLHHINDNCFC